MKILRIWNTAGVASIIAKFMDRLLGTKSLVVHRRALDPFGVTTYGELWDCSVKMFALKCILLARKFDIIHIHSFDELIPYLKILYPNKPIILHYHGTDIRGKRLQRKNTGVKLAWLYILQEIFLMMKRQKQLFIYLTL